MKKYQLFTLLMIFMALQASGQYSGGSGTQNDPYQIATLDDLSYLTQHENDWDKYFIQTADIDASQTQYWDDTDDDGDGDLYNDANDASGTGNNEGFLPIGTNQSNSFSGSYNGQGYKITHLYINRPSTDNIGLFGYTANQSGAYVKNIELTHVDVTGHNHVGGLIGNKRHVYTVTNCYITSGSVSGHYYVGGLIGDLVYGNVKKCFTSCSVTGDRWVGGLIGESYTGGSTVVQQSYSKGNVSGVVFIGGLIGRNTLVDVTNCYSKGSVTRSSESFSFLGSFCGYNDGAGIHKCYSTGAVYSSPGNLYGDGDGLTPDKGFVGGNSNGSYADNFFNKETSGQNNGIGATGKTTAEMKDYNTFTDEGTSGLSSAWDFVTNPNDDNANNDYWDMDQNQDVNNGYPILSWQDGADNTLKYAGGLGTSGNPYKIASLDDLSELAQNSQDWNKYFIQTADIDASQTQYWDDTDDDGDGDLYNDANDASGDGNNEGFLPIGNNGTKFTGEYNGDGYELDGLKIDRPGTGKVALFGSTDGAVIKNTDVTNVSVTGNGSVSALVGKADNSTSIENCSTSGSISSGDSYLAGIAGQALNSSSIKESNSSASVQTTNETHIYGAGGVVGFANTSVSVSKSYFTGSVSGILYGGGIVGDLRNSSTIKRCYSTGDISAERWVGGLAGDVKTSSSVTNSYSTGDVTRINGSPEDEFGAFCGRVNNATVENCYSTGSVFEAPGTPWSSNNKGFVGYDFNENTFNNNFFNSEVSNQDNGFGATGKNTAAMKDYNTFTDEGTSGLSSAWDFVTNPNDDNANNDYWDMDQYQDVNNGYPILSWQDGADNMLNKYDGGEGTSNNPYKIASLDDLGNLAQNPQDWDKYFIQTSDIDASQTQYWDDNDANGDGNNYNDPNDATSTGNNEGFLPIGNSSTKFTGEYDGDGYTIDNLKINRSGNSNIGLFGYTNGADISNLGVKNADVTGSTTVSVLAGKIDNNTTISKCFTKGSASGADVGGLVAINDHSSVISQSYSSVSVQGSFYSTGGLVAVNTNSSIIKNSYSTGSAAGDNSTNSNVGGLVGLQVENSSVVNCYSTASVQGSGDVGGLLALSYSSSVSNSFWDEEASGESSSAGGTGKNTAAMKDYNTFTDTDTEGLSSAWDFVTDPNDDNANNDYWDMDQYQDVNNGYPILSWQVGADNKLYKYDGGEGTSNNPYKIASLDDLSKLAQYSQDWDKYFIQTSDIDASQTQYWDDNDADGDGDLYNDANDASGDGNNEGFLPIGNSSVKFTGEYDGDGYTIDNLKINRSGNNNIGLFGYTNGADISNLGVKNADVTGSTTVSVLAGKIDNNTTISKCFTKGSASGVDVAGLVAINDHSSVISQSYSSVSVQGSLNNTGGLVAVNANSSTIKNSYSTGSAAGGNNIINSKVGGLVGIQVDNSSVVNCYSTASVQGSGNVGGLLARSFSSSVSNSFWDEEASGVSSSAGGTGKNTAVMKDYNTFTDEGTSGLSSAWDFVTNPNDDGSGSDFWDMDQNQDVNNGYPILSWQDGADNKLYKYDGGEGTSNNPYKIASLDDLSKLAQYSQDWDKYFIQTSDIDASQTQYWDDNDADGDGDLYNDANDASGDGNNEGFLPIGNSSSKFTGEYDGDGYTIDNLKINRSGNSNIGLFGYTNGAAISNLGVKNADVTGSQWVGVLAGRIENTAISKCFTKGSAYGTTSYVGGLVALNNNSSVISQSYSSVSAEVSNKTTGGLVAWNANSSTIKNSYSTGSATGGDNITYSYDGGLVGEQITNSSIVNCYSTASVQSDGYGGGLLANSNNSSVSNSFWDEEASGVSYSAGGTGKSTSEMQKRSTYTGWDFTNIWSIASFYNSGYPNLDGQTGGATITWDGSESSDWNTAANWDSNVIPSSSDDVIIADVENDPVVQSGTGAESKNLTVNGGATLTIDDGGSLITYGSITNNGNCKVKRTIGNGEWHMISVPNNNTTAGTFTGDYLQWWDESQASWKEITDESTALSPVKGYSLWGVARNTTYSFTGTPNTGNQSISINHTENGTNNDGANLVGNPYPSSIDWSTLNASYGSVYYWDPQSGDYLEWNGTGSGSQYIPPMQGFFVITDSDATFSLDNANRTHQGAENYYKSREKGSIEKGLILTGSNGSYADELYIVIDNEALRGFEKARDARKLLSGSDSVSQIYSMCPDGKLAIDKRPFESTLQLGFQNNRAGKYAIGLEKIAGLGNAVLEDTKRDKFHNLTKSNYEFEWKVDDNPSRFKLHLSTVGIEDEIINETKNLLIYANRQNIYLKTNENRSVMEVRVRDITGRIVLQRQIRKSGKIIIPTNLQTGVYVVEVIQNQQHTAQKVLIRQ